MSRETHARFLRRLEKDAAQKRDTVVGNCSGCGVGLLPHAFALGNAIRIGPDAFLCSHCEGGDRGAGHQ